MIKRIIFLLSLLLSSSCKSSYNSQGFNCNSATTTQEAHSNNKSSKFQIESCLDKITTKGKISGVVDNSVKVEKTGEACSINILGIVAFGDSSIETAIKNGGLKKVAYADTSYLSIIRLFRRGCTIVNGE